MELFYDQKRSAGPVECLGQTFPTEEVLQEDEKLLLWYDQAVTRAGGNL